MNHINHLFTDYAICREPNTAMTDIFCLGNWIFYPQTGWNVPEPACQVRAFTGLRR
jgi:hypothetical protein